MTTPAPTWAYYTEPETLMVRDLPVAYRRKGAGEPLLYLHGAWLTRRWLPLYDALAEQFDVIVPEHPGFGDTPQPDWLTEFADVVLHYADLLDTLDIERVHLVGHSLGGWIAAEFAAFFPDRVASLTLIAPAGLRPRDDERVVDLFRLSDEGARDALLGPDADRWLEILDEGDVTEAKIQEYKELIAAALLSWNPRYDVKLERRLGRIDSPAQILLPQQERLLPESVGPRYGELIAGAELVTVPGEQAPTQHLLVLQEPDQIAGLVAAVASRA